MLLRTLLMLPGLAPGPYITAPDSLELVRETWVMGTRLVISVERDSTGAEVDASEAVLENIQEVEKLLSTWDPASELSRLNSSEVNQDVMPTSDVAKWLSRASELVDRTEGAFDVSIGALINAWDLRADGRRPSAVELARAREASGSRAISIDRVTGRVTRHDPQAWIDAGAFGKGVALQEVANYLKESHLKIFVDLGGQLWLSPASDTRTINVAHPSDRERSIHRMLLPPGHSVATSGYSEKGVSVEGERLGHILDPRTGRPSATWGSVSVVSDDPIEADALATALYVMGPKTGPLWAESHGDVAALFLIETPSGVRAEWTTSMEPLVIPAQEQKQNRINP